ncbi:MAG: calcium-binding protein, partial [Planctomycetaceae bacterium]
DDVIELHHHDYVMQNDVVHGDAGDDTIIGDHSLKLLPAASSLQTRSDHPDPQEVPLQVQNETSRALGDIASARSTEMRAHLKDNHVKSEIPKRRDQKLVPFKFEYTVSMSNDELNGDDGVDVIIGDRAETVMPILLESPERNSDASQLVASLNATTNRGRLRSQIEIREPVSHVEHRYFTGRIHKSTTEPAESVRQDTIDGGAHGDTLIGDNAEVKPIFIRDVTRDQVTYAVTPIEIREGGDDIIHGGLGNDVVFGQMGDDFIRGNEGKDTLWGGRGEDEIHGDAGADEIRGGGNRDKLRKDAQDTKVLAGGGNGINDVDIAVHNPWGSLVDNIFSAADSIDPNTNLWETFIRGDEEGGE